jgi:hypothetical protein
MVHRFYSTCTYMHAGFIELWASSCLDRLRGWKNSCVGGNNLLLRIREELSIDDGSRDNADLRTRPLEYGSQYKWWAMVKMV